MLLGLIAVLPGCNNSGSDSGRQSSAVNTYPPAVVKLYSQVGQNPDSTGLRMLLAGALDSMGAFKEAILQMDTLIFKDSSNYGLWYSKGQILQDAKDTLQAIEAFNRAISIYPSPDALLSLANLYAERKNPQSLVILGQVKELGLGNEYNAHCSFIAGVYQSRTGHRDLAINLFNQCIADDFTYMEAYIEKGLVYFDEHQYRDALQVFSFASNVDHLFPDSYYWMARCYEMMGNKDSAILRFKQSLSLDKTIVEAKEGLKRLGAE